MVSEESAIRRIVGSSVEAYAVGFEGRHIGEHSDPNGTINMKIHNVFIAALGPEIQYYTALVRSLDSSLGNMLESMAINIAQLFYKVSQHVEGPLYPEQTRLIAELLESYKSHASDSNLITDKSYDDIFFSEGFWNFICGSDSGYDIIRDEIRAGCAWSNKPRNKWAAPIYLRCEKFFSRRSFCRDKS